jgi:hypothetical protein
MLQRFQILRKTLMLQMSRTFRMFRKPQRLQRNPSHPKLQPAVASYLIRTCRGWTF